MVNLYSIYAPNSFETIPAVLSVILLNLNLPSVPTNASFLAASDAFSFLFNQMPISPFGAVLSIVNDVFNWSELSTTTLLPHLSSYSKPFNL